MREQAKTTTSALGIYPFASGSLVIPLYLPYLYRMDLGLTP